MLLKCREFLLLHGTEMQLRSNIMPEAEACAVVRYSVVLVSYQNNHATAGAWDTLARYRAEPCVVALPR